MVFVGEDFLGVAERLIAMAASAEPEDRTAIGRAYYAAFLYARDYLEAETNARLRHPGAHSKVRKEIEPLNQQLALDLWRLSDWRMEADYAIPYPGTDARATAEAAIELARDIMLRVDALPRTNASGTPTTA